MKLVSAIAIYFVIWWIVLFAVLPFGVRNSDEAGEVLQEGHEAGAPVKAMLARKFLITSLIAAAVFAAIYIALLNRTWFA